MEDGQHIPLNFERLSEEEMRQTADRMFERFNSRRTVRHFSAEPLPLDVVRQCIRAAGTAPSGAHKQPWHFCLVTDPDIKKRIRVAAEKEEYENYHGRMSEVWLDDEALWYRPHQASPGGCAGAHRGFRQSWTPDAAAASESPRITTSKSRLESPVVCCCPRCTNAALRP